MMVFWDSSGSGAPSDDTSGWNRIVSMREIGIVETIIVVIVVVVFELSRSLVGSVVRQGTVNAQ